MIRVGMVARCAVLIGALGGVPLSAMRARAQERREAIGPLRIHPQNPRYFADGGGRAVYLTGSHTWSNLQDQGPKDPPKPFDYEGYLNFLLERNHNVIRLWAWEQARWARWSDGKTPNPSDWFIRPNPYARTGPGMALDGKPKFDLKRWDDSYFDRLRTRVRTAGERGVYVSVMLFQGWSSAKSWLGGTVDLSGAKGKLSSEWMHPVTGKITAGDAVEGGGKRTLKVPFTGDAVLYLRAMP